MAMNKAKKPVKNTTASDCGGIKPDKLFPPKDENKSKPAKGGHYTPPNSSKDLPPSFYNPLNGKGKKKGIPDD